MLDDNSCRVASPIVNDFDLFDIPLIVALQPVTRVKPRELNNLFGRIENSIGFVAPLVTSSV